MTYYDTLKLDGRIGRRGLCYRYGKGMCYGAFVKMVIVPKRVCSSEGTSICADKCSMQI
jgi:hypothetical protein